MIIEGWILTIILMLVIPFALATIGGMRKGQKFDTGIFMCSLAVMMIYLIYVGALPSFALIFAIIVMGFMFFGGGSSDE